MLKRTACGQDELPYRFFRDFAHDLAPAFADVFHSSLQQHKVPSSWKMAHVKPLQNESPLTSCNQLRPVSLIAFIMRLFDRLVYRYELSSICNDYIGLDQFAYCEGHNSTMALIKCQHTWLKWLDGNDDFVLTLVRPSTLYHTIFSVVNWSKLKLIHVLLIGLLVFLDQRK